MDYTHKIKPAEVLHVHAAAAKIHLISYMGPRSDRDSYPGVSLDTYITQTPQREMRANATHALDGADLL
jgi:hypothetical protein